MSCLSFVLSRQQSRELDHRAMHEFGVPGIVLMENAGRGAAELLMRLNPNQHSVIIVCGPGNNGGDGYVMARHLSNHGWPVAAWSLADSLPTQSDAVTNYQIARRCGLVCETDQGAIINLWPKPIQSWFSKEPCWIVDALFGTGLSRGLSTPYDQVIEAINTAGYPVLAVDIPSGLDCDTGEPLGPTIRATHTATFVAPKLGFRNPKSSEWTGQVHVIDIGAPKQLIDQYR
jgi:NAD(P)H-hydrate epimerase